VSGAVLDPEVRTEPATDWVILDDTGLWEPREADLAGHVRMRGRGVDRHGLISAEGIVAAPRNLVALPSVDDLYA